MSNDSGTELRYPVDLQGYDLQTFHTQHKVQSTGTLDLWRDGLLCAYEFLPAPSKKFKVGANFGNQNGHVQGRLDCEISVKHPQDYLGIDLNRSHDSFGGVSEDCRPGSTASGVGSLGTEVQGFVVRESLLKDEEKAPSPTSSSPRGFHDHRWNGKKEPGPQWIPIGWPRLSELFQAVQVCLCHPRSLIAMLRPSLTRQLCQRTCLLVVFLDVLMMYVSCGISIEIWGCVFFGLKSG